jgi:hypothetical protein
MCQKAILKEQKHYPHPATVTDQNLSMRVMTTKAVVESYTMMGDEETQASHQAKEFSIHHHTIHDTVWIGMVRVRVILYLQE